MSGLIESASAILALQAKRLEIAGHNVANATTPGYKSESVFAELVNPARGARQAAVLGNPEVLPTAVAVTDLSPGKLTQTSNPMDLAITGPGFFQVSSSAGIGYTRAGQFHLDDNNRFVTSQGWVLQGEGGGNLTVRSKAFTLQSDGTIIEDGRPASKIVLFNLDSSTPTTRAPGGVLQVAGAQPAEVDVPALKQGYLEASNVNTAGDMVHLMESVQLSESAQKLILTYDDLMGRVLSTLGQMQ